MKVVTLATAAKRLGWSYAYETRLLGIGAVDFGFLDGDLAGSRKRGPEHRRLGWRRQHLFASWADRLKAAGVRTIGGRIVGDDNQFDDEGLGPGWTWDDLGASFATGAGALQFNQNTARARIVAGSLRPAEPAAIELSPPSGGLTVRNRLTTAVAGTTPAVELRRSPGSDVVEIRGVVPDGGARVLPESVRRQPDAVLRDGAARRARRQWHRGSRTGRGHRPHPDPPRREDGVPLVTHRSLPLSRSAVTMMTLSQNLYAETLLKTMGDGEVRRSARRPRRRPWRCSMDGTWTAQDVLLADGSGLSRYNLITAKALATVLGEVAADTTLGPLFEASLPIAGRDGTLAARMAGTRAEGNARAKTGSFSNARALAGYLRTADGERMAFAMIANNFGTPPGMVERAMDAMVVRLADFTRR